MHGIGFKKKQHPCILVVIKVATSLANTRHEKVKFAILDTLDLNVKFSE
jgi:hypothetical protein